MKDFGFRLIVYAVSSRFSPQKLKQSEQTALHEIMNVVLIVESD